MNSETTKDSVLDEVGGDTSVHSVRRARGGARRALGGLGPVAALVVVAVFFAILDPRFLSLDNVRAVLDIAAAPALVAVGATFVILMGRIDLSVEGVMATVSISLSLLVMNSRTDFALGGFGVLIALLVGGTFGVVTAIIHSKLKVPSFLVTLGMWFVGLGVGTVLFAGATPRLADSDLLALVNGNVLGIPNTAVTAILCTAIGAVVLKYTKFGRSVLAIGGDEKLALLNGVPNVSVKIICFAIAGVCSALAAVIATVQVGVGSVSIGTGTGALFAGITAVVIGGTALTGGRGGVWRSFVGALIIALITNGLILLGVDPNVQDIVRGLIIVVGVSAVAWSQRSRLKVVK